MAERKQGDKEPSPFERALKWIGAAMGPVLAFSKIVELPLPYQILLIVVAVLLAVVSIFVLRKKEIIIVVLMALLGFALMTGIAAVLKPLLDRFTQDFLCRENLLHGRPGCFGKYEPAV
jgi:hypothetical protein